MKKKVIYKKKKQDLKLLINISWFRWKVWQKAREFVKSMMILFIITTAVRKKLAVHDSFV